ncbi:MAG: uracil-DNA glycosylase [Oscillospiraceae bacterium]|jgi:DNA polymerase|nr:uracil-DNA glycosylase [Oscillospiraceae bacterium]
MTAAMHRLHQECEDFFKQIYIGESRVVVFGDGDESAPVILVGEAPGEHEALERRPFAGKAGRVLDEFLESIELPRPSVYITNAVKFRPTKQSKSGRTINRAPTREEVALWRPWLIKELAIVNPKLVVTLGNTALRAVTGRDVLIGDTHGQVISIEGMPQVFALHHPASVIYKKALPETYQKDLSVLKGLLARLNQ